MRNASNKGATSVHQILSDNATFLSRVNTGNGSWIYGYEPEIKQQFSQWKGPNSPRPKRGKTGEELI
jgi:hypothetical protein